MTDYRLTGPSSVAAVEAGLANAEWFAPAIDTDRLHELPARSAAAAGRKPVRSPLRTYDVTEHDGRIVTHLAVRSASHV